MSVFNEPLLLVPMHVDALAVGELPASAFQWTNLAPNFSKLQDDYQFGAALVGDDGATGNPFDEAHGLESGIHLHFRLPRAFTHGRQEGAGALSFPVIPNRWLVQRFGDASYKAWLIQSDAPAPENAPAIPWPLFPQNEDTPVEFKRIGTCTELTAPLADVDEPARVKLTVVGQGNPFFSGYYPACHSVLGFHDRMEGVSPGARVSYLVTGWFSTAHDDPLYTAAWRTGTGSPELRNAWFTERQWTGTISPDDEERFRTKHNLPGETPLSPEQRAELGAELRDAWFTDDGSPSRLLCHGLVRGMIWHEPAYNYMQPPSGAGDADSGPEVFPLNLPFAQIWR